MNETRRLAALRRYDVLDSAPEEAFDEITRMAARLFNVPVSLVSLVDESRQWFKSRVGLELTQTPRDISFCSHALNRRDVLEIADATLDERFRENPLVSGAPGIRFYAGVPLSSPEGHVLGTLCVIDSRPRSLDEREKDLLRSLGRQVVGQLELRRVSAELARREEHLHQAFEAAGLGTWAWDLGSEEVRLSDQALQLLGLKEADTVRSIDSLCSLFLPEDAAAARRLFDACLAGQASRVRLEAKALAGGSALRWLQIEGKVYTEAANGRRRLSGVIRDMTGQKAREEVVRTSEHHFRSYFEMPLVGFAESSADMRWIEANARFCDMLGYTWEELRSRSWASLTHPEDLHLDLAQFKEVIAGRSDGYSLEKRYLRKDGSILHAEISVRCLRRPDGSAESFAAMVQDISERKTVELALRENERRLSLIFNNSTDAMALLRVEGDGRFRIVSANARFVERLAATGDNMFIEDIVDLPLPPDGGGVFGVDTATGCPTAERLARIAASGGDVETFEERTRAGEGVLFGETVLTPVPDVSGRCVFILYSSRDITERERDKKQRDLLEAQLRQAQKMEAIGTLAGGIAHDFNNILGAIIAYTDLALMDQGDPEAQKEDFGQIMKASDRAKKLVEQILSFSRQQKQERRPVRLQPVINEVLRLLRSTIPATITVHVAVQPDAPTVVADPTQIHQVMMNLSTNASHAMRGEGILGVRLERVVMDERSDRDVPNLRSGSYALLTVTDNGHGMAPQTVKRIFEPFFTTKPPGEGSGLGLSVAHGIVKEHDGFITVDSVPGRGTSFRIYFPEHAVHNGEELASRPQIPAGQGQHVLVVDDEPAICHALGRMLQRIGYVATLASSPEQGLELFTSDPASFHVVITDLTMPGMTGPDMAARMMEIRPDVPLLLATGFSGTWNRSTALEFGFHDLLDKPVSITTLAESLHAVLRVDPPKDVVASTAYPV
jgi:PAS domain S-box-containing protein